MRLPVLLVVGADMSLVPSCLQGLPTTTAYVVTWSRPDGSVGGGELLVHSVKDARAAVTELRNQGYSATSALLTLYYRGGCV